MKDRLLALRPLLVKLIGFPLFFGFWFLLFVYVTFPYDRLKEAIVAAAEAPHRTPAGTMVPSTMELSIGSVGPTFFPGLHLRDVNLTLLPQRPADHASRIHLSDVAVHVGLLGLITGTINADVDVDGIGGTVRGHIEVATNGPRAGLRALRLHIESVQLAQLAPVQAAIGLPTSGALGADVDFRVPDGRIERAEGSVTFAVDGLRIGDGHAQYMIPGFSGGLTVDQIDAGRLEGNVPIHDGVATIQQLSNHSTEFRFAMDGQIELRGDLSLSVINAGVRLQLTEAYRHKGPHAESLMAVMSMPMLSVARHSDGMFWFRCRGTLDGNLRCPPDTGRGGPTPPGSTGPRGFPGAVRTRGFGRP